MFTSSAKRRGRVQPLVAATAMAATLLAVATPARGQPSPSDRQPALLRQKLRGGLPLAYAAHPRFAAPGRPMARRERVPVMVELASTPTTDDVEALRRAGAVVDPRLVTASFPGERVLSVRAGWAAVQAIAALPRVRTVSLDGSPFGSPRPLDATAAEVTATDLWGALDGAGLPATGAGMILCDIDSGVDVFHAMFFRPDAGYYPWLDVDGDGVLTAGVDAVDLDGSGHVTVLRILDGIITNYWDDVPLFDSDRAGLELGIDWLYADLDGDGSRSYGRGAGFDDGSPSFREPLFVVDDVDRDGHIEPDEKLVGLGSSKLRAVRIDEEVYRRGDNLIDNPAGNLSGSRKLFKRPLAAGGSTSVPIAVPADSPYGRFQMLGLTLLWRDTSRALEVTLEDPTGFTLAMPTSDGYIYQDWHDGTVVYAERSDSSRGTSKLDVYVDALQATGGCLCATPFGAGAGARPPWLLALALTAMAFVRRSRRSLRA